MTITSIFSSIPAGCWFTFSALSALGDQILQRCFFPLFLPLPSDCWACRTAFSTLSFSSVTVASSSYGSLWISCRDFLLGGKKFFTRKDVAACFRHMEETFSLNVLSEIIAAGIRSKKPVELFIFLDANRGNFFWIIQGPADCFHFSCRNERTCILDSGVRRSLYARFIWNAKIFYPQPRTAKTTDNVVCSYRAEVCYSKKLFWTKVLLFVSFHKFRWSITEYRSTNLLEMVVSQRQMNGS